MNSQAGDQDGSLICPLAGVQSSHPASLPPSRKDEPKQLKCQYNPHYSKGRTETT